MISDSFDMQSLYPRPNCSTLHILRSGVELRMKTVSTVFVAASIMIRKLNVGIEVPGTGVSRILIWIEMRIGIDLRVPITLHAGPQAT